MSFSSDSDLEIVAIVDAALAAYPDKIAAYRDGNTPIFGFLLGQAMKLSDGLADARLVNEELRRRLESEAGSQ